MNKFVRHFSTRDPFDDPFFLPHTPADMEQRFQISDMEESMFVGDMEQSFPVSDMEQSVPISDIEQSFPVSDMEQSVPISDIEQSFPVSDMEQSVPVPDIAHRKETFQGTFVSRHSADKSEAIVEFLQRKHMNFKTGSEGKVQVEQCPFCHDTKGKPDNLWKLVIFPNGRCFCIRCQTNASFYDYKAILNGDTITVHPGTKSAASSQAQPQHNLPNQREMIQYESDLDNPQFAAVKQYLTDRRGLSNETLKRYGIGAKRHRFRSLDASEGMVDSLCITFPWARLDSTSPTGKSIDRIKVRDYNDKRNMRLHPHQGQLGFFGWDTISASDGTIVITEGEFDAMSVYQATGLPAISLPNGASSLPPYLLPCLERFQRILLWMDDDLAGQQGAEKFAKKLGIKRTLIVKTMVGSNTSAKDANDALLQGHDLNECIRLAKPLQHNRIGTFRDFKDELFQEIAGQAADELNGMPYTTLPSFTKITKGHRRGELTILTGPTGMGKTTILSQLSVDLCAQGVRTLWGSFEIKNVRLIEMMLCQHYGSNVRKAVSDEPSRFEFFSDRFEELAMYFMKFHGSSEVDEIIDAMEHAVYAYDVEHIILDNLQFMLSTSTLSPGAWKFDVQDRAVSLFRKFATEHNVHISLCVHPRKEVDGSALGVSSVFGSAKVTQEADNVILLQRLGLSSSSPVCMANAILDESIEREMKKNNEEGEPNQVQEEIAPKELRTLNVQKNRYDGTLGHVAYVFDKESRKIMEMTAEQAAEMKSRLQLEEGRVPQRRPPPAFSTHF